MRYKWEAIEVSAIVAVIVVAAILTAESHVITQKASETVTNVTQNTTPHTAASVTQDTTVSLSVMCINSTTFVSNSTTFISSSTYLGNRTVVNITTGNLGVYSTGQTTACKSS